MIERKIVEIFANVTNSPVLRLPSRKFPGILIQGDTLSSYFSLAKEVLDLGKKEEINENIIDIMEELVNSLDMHLSLYESILEDEGIQLPYIREPLE